MLSKTLIVCLLAFLCLNLATAARLDTRIAGANGASQGQFPYIAFLTYNYQDGANLVSEQFTGIIYSSQSIITTASSFDNFPAGATLTIEVGAWDINNPVQGYQFTPTIGTYEVNGGGAVPTDLIVIPTQYTQGDSTYNVAIVTLDSTITPNTFDFTNAEIAIANFPTSSPVPSENFYAVAYGNVAPDAATFPFLKYTRLFLKKAKLCQDALSSNGLNALDRSSQFCVQSQALDQTNNVFEGVCKLDIGGAVVRTDNPTDPTSYYEVVGLIAYADDDTTCDSTTRVPAVINYLSFFQDGFFTPILGSLATAGNGQDATQNPRSNRGNFICGNGVVEGVERCDPTDASTEPCCSPNTCNFKKSGKLCAAKASTPDVCLTNQICDLDGVCAARVRNQGKDCDDSGSKCSAGVCGSA